jgi:hypothetical protein
MSWSHRGHECRDRRQNLTSRGGFVARRFRVRTHPDGSRRLMATWSPENPTFGTQQYLQVSSRGTGRMHGLRGPAAVTGAPCESQRAGCTVQANNRHAPCVSLQISVHRRLVHGSRAWARSRAVGGSDAMRSSVISAVSLNCSGTMPVALRSRYADAFPSATSTTSRERASIVTTFRMSASRLPNCCVSGRLRLLGMGRMNFSSIARSSGLIHRSRRTPRTVRSKMIDPGGRSRADCIPSASMK